MTARFRRPDAKGRSSALMMPREAKLIAIPAPFTAIPVAVMRSEAFRTLGIHARRVLDALLIEHNAHAGTENGRLVATYDQLERDFGISRRKISPAIHDLEKRGLIRRTSVGHGSGRTGEHVPSRYRLTFLGSLPDRMGPTDEWQHFTATKPHKISDRPVSQSNVAGGPLVAPARRSRGGTSGA